MKMHSSCIQFHAQPEELVEFITSVLDQFTLQLVCVTLFPFSARILKREELEAAVLDSERGPNCRIVFFTHEPHLSVSTLNEFRDSNPNTITVEIGRLTESGLEESCLTYWTEDSEVYAIAKQVAASLKKRTNAGAVALNPTTGAESRLRTHRYTTGAQKLDQGGTKILPVAGTSILRLRSRKETK